MLNGFNYHSSRKDYTNFAFLRHLRYSGFLVSMHQSGTHWLKYLLSVAIAREYNLPMPQYNHANDIIGGPKDPRLYDNAPRLASSHSIPNPLLRSFIIRSMVNLPRYVVLVRDIRYSLISNYEKWLNRYNCSFSEFLRGDITGNRYNNDIWWCIRFMNAWGKLIDKYPDDHLLVRYEDLTNDALAQVNRINKFWHLGIREDYLKFAIQESTKEKMLLKHDPGRPAGEIRMKSKTFEEISNEDDRAFFRHTCASYLEHGFGYPYPEKTN